MPLGLNLGNLLGSITGAVDDLLGGGVGNIVDGLAPGDLIDDLGGTLNDLLGGGAPTGLLQDLLDNNLLDLSMLQEVLGSTTGGALDLGTLDDLLGSANIGDLGRTLNDVFDSPLLGILGTVVNSNEVRDLTAGQLDQTVRYVTSLVGTILATTGDPLEVDKTLDSLLLGDNDLSGDDKDNVIDGREGNDTIAGLGGNDNLSGGTGDDSLNGGGGNDTINGGDDNDKLLGSDGNDRLYGDAGVDTLNGGEGNDRLDGGLGADVMIGGIGNDLFVVNNKGDVVMEDAGGGVDLVRTSRDYTLSANVENMQLLGDANLKGTGNVLANRIDGNGGDNVIDGAGGNDVLFGGKGVDVLTGGSGNDIFRWTSADESGMNAGQRDIVTDFGSGDRISVLAFDGNLARDGNQGFRFVGDGNFNGKGFGEVGYTISGGNTLVNVDTDGDGTANFRIELTGVHNLTASDFIL